jgi:hypothetical protein
VPPPGSQSGACATGQEIKTVGTASGYALADLMPRYGRAARHELGLLAVHKTVLAAFLKRIKVQWDSFAPTFSQVIGLVCFARCPTEHNELRCPELFRDHSIDQRTAVSDFNFNLIAWLEEFATWHSNSCWCAG